VPLLFRLPGKIPSGLRLDEPVSLLDLAPTLCGFLRGRIPAEYEGVSLHQVLLGEQTLPPREALLVQSVSRRNPGLALHSVITHEAKMTCYPGHPWGEFYHLIEDPQETRNLYRELSGDIRSKYYEHLLNMLDPTRFLPPLPEWET
jgi:arylsulfatase A-like enzyme